MIKNIINQSVNADFKSWPTSPRVILPALMVSCIMLSACQRKADTNTGKTEMRKAETSSSANSYDIINTQGNVIGSVSLTDLGDKGTELHVIANGIPEGEHGMHLHVTGSCQTPDFTSAGGHINIMGHQHGLSNPDGPDNADMPNAIAGADMNINMTATNDRVSLHGTDILPALLDDDGSALIIHQNPDDQMTQPIGGAGPRIACAVIDN